LNDAVSDHRTHDVHLATLTLTFAWISATAFGGASIPAMRQQFTRRLGWITDVEFLEIYSIAQVSPGAIPVSLACLIGRRVAGTPGFFIGLIAETLPGFFVLMAIALISMDPHMSIVRSALRGCAAAAAGLLFSNSLELTWPYRTKIIDLSVLVAVAIAVLVFHASLLVMFSIFIPISIALVRATKAA